MPQITGKTLLLLGGSSVSSAEIVEYAKSQGVYVIVADNQQTNAAKRLAHEKWLISTVDTDRLAARAGEARVNGVFAGVSEFNIESAIKISATLGLPFYASWDQWTRCKNKNEFKQLCRCHGVPVVKQYSVDEQFQPEVLERIQYPIIVKPADGSAADGVFVCNDEDELKGAYFKSRHFSESKTVLVEEHVNGDEVVAYYTLKNGTISLSSMCDKYLCTEETGATPLPGAYIYPSRHLSQFIEQVDESVKKMFLQMGLTNGVLGVQGFVSKGRFLFFEMGYRLGGTAQYRYTKQLNGINNLEMLVNHSLTGTMYGYDLSLDNPFFQKSCCTFSLLSHEGTVASIRGLERVTCLPGVVHMEQRYCEGEFVRRSGSVRQVILRFNLIEESIDAVYRTMAYIRDVTDVIDSQGKSMLFSHL